VTPKNPKGLIIESWQHPRVIFILKPSCLAAGPSDPAAAAPAQGKPARPQSPSHLVLFFWSRENKDKP